MALPLTAIPSDFGQGGANLNPSGNKPRLREILVEHKNTIEDASRDRVLRKALGIVHQTYDFGTQTGATILAAGTAYYIGIGLLAGDLITNINLIVNQSLAVAMTVSLVGIYDKTGTRLAVSADQGASWQTFGLKTIPLTAPLTIPTTDIYYIGIFGAGGTLPQITRGTLISATGTPQFSLGGNKAWAYGQTGQVTLPSPATFADTGNAILIPYFWFGLT